MFVEFAIRVKNVDLKSYRKSFIARRLAARLMAHKISSVSDYQQLLTTDYLEWNSFFENLCINVSEFFRDSDVFLAFQKVAIPEIVSSVAQREDKMIRIWSCGCSCGEESYSLAIAFMEFFRKYGNSGCKLKITATDIDVNALMQARQGIYFDKSLVNVSGELRERYFEYIPQRFARMEEDAWHIKDEVKQIVSFERHNLVSDKMLSGMDVIFLRNVRIYFDAQRAKDIVVSAHQVLNNNGFFVLGKMESIGISLRHLFESIDAVGRIYRKL